MADRASNATQQVDGVGVGGKNLADAWCQDVNVAKGNSFSVEEKREGQTEVKVVGRFVLLAVLHSHMFKKFFLMSRYGTVFDTLRPSLAQAKSLWRSKCVVLTCTDLKVSL